MIAFSLQLFEKISVVISLLKILCSTAKDEVYRTVYHLCNKVLFLISVEIMTDKITGSGIP